jgi:hypothetical protein
MLFPTCAAYATMQEILRNNNTSINSMQGQIQMLCNANGSQLPANMLQYPQKQHSQDRQVCSGHCGQQQSQCQQGQPIGGGCGTNNGGGGNELYKGNGGGGGYYQVGGINFNGGSGSYPTPGTSQAV